MLAERACPLVRVSRVCRWSAHSRGRTLGRHARGRLKEPHADAADTDAAATATAPTHRHGHGGRANLETRDDHTSALHATIQLGVVRAQLDADSTRLGCDVVVSHRLARHRCSSWRRHHDDHMSSSPSSGEEYDQHEWLLHVNTSSGDVEQCPLCASQVRRLHGLPAELLTILSHEYATASRRLLVTTQCTLCTGIARREADDILSCGVLCKACETHIESTSSSSSRSPIVRAVRPRPDAVIIPSDSDAASDSPTIIIDGCDASSSTNSSPQVSCPLPVVIPLSVDGGASPHGTSAHDAIEIDDDDSGDGDASSGVGSSDSEECVESARVILDLPSDDDEVTLVTILRRRVISAAAKLRRRTSAASPGSRSAPISIPDSPIGLADECMDRSALVNAGRPMCIHQKVADESAPSFAAGTSLVPPPMPVRLTPSPPRRIAPNLRAARKRASPESPIDATTKRSRCSSDGASTRPGHASGAPCSPSPPPTFTSGARSASGSPYRRVPFDMTMKGGGSFAPSDPRDLFSSFVRVDPNAAAKRQQALFAQAKKRLDLRRQLNMEPEPVSGAAEPLPFQAGAAAKNARVPFSECNSNAANAATSKLPFVLPSFLRSESGAEPYTPSERQRACDSILSSRAGPPCVVLCLPNMHPHTWPRLVTSVTGCGTGTSDALPSATAGGLLAHHYRRLAKLVHPDKCPPDVHADAEGAFKALHHAYKQLLAIV